MAGDNLSRALAFSGFLQRSHHRRSCHRSHSRSEPSVAWSPKALELIFSFIFVFSRSLSCAVLGFLPPRSHKYCVPDYSYGS